MSVYNTYIKKYLPEKLQLKLTNLKIFLLDTIRPLRVSKFITRIFGFWYKRSTSAIEIDITYKCNLSCANCNRSCSQLKTNESMTIDQIKDFIKQSIERNIKWKKISLVGGEPLIHENIFEIINLILDYKNHFSRKTKIYLVTNGILEEKLNHIPKDIIIINSNKKTRVNKFISFNVAPIDLKQYQNKDFRNGCSILKYCGMGLNMYGYYPCAVAGGIDRIFKMNMGRKEIPEKNDLMLNELNTFCRLCGHFKKHDNAISCKISKTWEEAYEKFKQ
ncbi:MAG TPA: 4Fe-4S cluster-binding domain-containing protein [bacterium]|nr:4Fe-4S cluster-binding domain-containing protein [bacterium]